MSTLGYAANRIGRASKVKTERDTRKNLQHATLRECVSYMPNMYFIVQDVYGAEICRMYGIGLLEHYANNLIMDMRIKSMFPFMVEGTQYMGFSVTLNSAPPSTTHW